MKLNLMTFFLLSTISINVLANEAKINIYTPNAPAPIGTYSQAIQFEKTVYVSGQIPINPKTGELIQGDFKTQIRQVFTNLSEIAKASGHSINDCLKLTIFTTDLKHFNDINDIMKTYFTEPYPARSVIEVKALPKNASVEIEAIIGSTQ